MELNRSQAGPDAREHFMMIPNDPLQLNPPEPELPVPQPPQPEFPTPPDPAEPESPTPNPDLPEMPGDPGEVQI